MAEAKLGQWLFLLACAVTLLKAAGVPVEITYVQSAVAKGAVCLDGSPPAYHLDKGFGSGINNWLVHIEAILSGCSAGGLASILHCDNFHALLPVGTNVKCVSDAGYFINVKDVSGAQHIEEFFSQVVETHGSARNLPPSCTSKLRPGLCFFPQYMASQIRTRIFFVNAAYDSWQIKNILAPGVADPHGTWHECKLDIKNCSPTQLEAMQDFRVQFLSAIGGMTGCPLKGMFIDSCYAHCQTEMQETWLMADSPVLNKTTIAKAVGNWFYDRTPFQKIDCPYPCNPTCHNRVFDPNQHLLEQ